jgi:hypothetical protein
MFKQIINTIIGLSAFTLSLNLPSSITSSPSPTIKLAQNTQQPINIDFGELLYDFTPVSELQVINKESRDPSGQANNYKAIQFIAQAKHFVLPLGYFAYAYDQNGVEVGVVPMEINPAGSIQQGSKIYVIIPVELFPSNAAISTIVVKRL